MGLFDRIFGAEEQAPPPPRPRSADTRTDDEIAVERYRYLLRTAPPETIEQVHAEAFAKLTDEQRALIFTELSQNAPAGEAPRGSDPASLAQAATRSELRQPGVLERSFQGRGAQGGPSFGAMVGSSLLGTIAGYVIGSAIVSSFLPNDAGQADAGADSGGDTSGDAGADASADAGGDVSGGDGGFGGGDFGGGDFGGDFGF